MSNKSKLQRIAYVSGPVDGVEAFYAWVNNWPLKYFGDSHISQYIQLCADMDLNSLIITTNERERNKYRVGRFVFENISEPKNYCGLQYQVYHIIWTIRILLRLAVFRPHIVVITTALGYGFLFSILRLFGVRFVAVLTCTLWPKFTEFAQLKKFKRAMLYLNSLFFRRCVSAAINASDDIARQVRVLLRSKKIPISVFLPMYDRSQFAQFEQQDYSTRPFRVFFAGRIETNKGVFDLVTIAQQLETNGFHGFHFDVCGDGSKLDELREHVEALGLSQMITCHGFCDRHSLMSVLQKAHVVIVPTTTEFQEGFNMVCAESILAVRPVITSPVCPALEYVTEAAIEVRPNDVNGYYQALLRISNDQELYETKVAACRVAQQQFYDVTTSWKAKLREVLDGFESRK